MPKPLPRLDPQASALLVVDLQKRLLPHIHNAPSLLRRAARLVEGFAALELPMIVTEQYPRGLGPTVNQVARHLPAGTPIFDKLLFSACIDPVREVLAQRKVRSVVVCGIEAHVCVLQTTLDLLDAGLTVAVAFDAIGSRRETDQAAAEQRMLQAAAIPATTESILFELAGTADGKRFKAIRSIIQ